MSDEPNMVYGTGSSSADAPAFRCMCQVCCDHRRWVAALVRDEASREAFDEIWERLEAAETDNAVHESIMNGTWPSAEEQLRAALKRFESDSKAT